MRAHLRREGRRQELAVVYLARVIDVHVLEDREYLLVRDLGKLTWSVAEDLAQLFQLRGRRGKGDHLHDAITSSATFLSSSACEKACSACNHLGTISGARGCTGVR
eukprot:scaffold55576_cov62-Phaeocystis_antarctica.AAC.1